MTQDFESQLAQLRARIDRIDAELIALLHQRMEVIPQVAALKAAHSPAACHIRSGREGAMHGRIFNAFSEGHFPASAALSIWRQIIGASTHHESPITVAAPQGDMRWLAREYFGRMIGFAACDSVASSLTALAEGKASIALIPAPTADTLAQWAALAALPALKVFAALPVALAPGESPAAYAVASITPEASGDDLSLLLLPAGKALPEGRILAQNAEHTLLCVPGMSDDPHCIGSLAAPLIDSTLQPWLTV